MNRILLLVLIPLALIATSCGKEPLKEAGLQGESTVSAVRDLVSAYERRDIEAFMGRIASSYKDRDAFRSAVENVFGSYQNIRFIVQYRKMMVDVLFKGPIKAALTWEGEWKTLGGKIIKDGSRVTLVLEQNSFKVSAIEGKNPFLPLEMTVPARK